MKKLNLSFLLVTFSILSFAQAPQAFKYQAVIRDNAGEIVSNTDVSFKFVIREDHINGNIVYKETHSVTTNQFGLANLEIGNGTPVIGEFDLIDWRLGRKFLEVKIDLEGGSNFISMGTSQLLSVPFSMYAENSSPSEKISDSDGDTYITTEQTPNEDTIRMFIEGTEKYKFTERAIEPVNNAGSIIIGQGAGPDLDLIENTEFIHNNVFIGANSGSQLIEGYENVAFGYEALGNSNAGYGLVAIGSHALYSNMALDNTAVGHHSLFSNTYGHANTSMGNHSMFENTLGVGNTAYGYSSLLENTTGNSNVSIGSSSLRENITGSDNTAIGTNALNSNISGNSNIACGYNSLASNIEGSGNVVIGNSALNSNTIGSGNIGIGNSALSNNISGFSNVACGADVLTANIDGFNNVAVGVVSIPDNIHGSYNVAVGSHTLDYKQSGDFNTAIGEGAGSHKYVSTMTNTGAFGYGSIPDSDNQCRIGNLEVISIGGYVPWTTLADKNFQKNISGNVSGLDFILKLEPITYHLDVNKLEDFLGIPDSIQKNEFMIQSAVEKEAVEQSGFVAQDVEELAQSLGYNFSGVDAPKNENGIYGLRYAEFVVPLVKAVQEQQAEIENLKKRIADLEKKGIDKKINYKSF